MKPYTATFNLSHSPETVFQHWVSPETIIPPAISLEIEPIVGGIYKLVMPGEVSMVGKFVEVEPDRKLRYSWQWQDDPEITEVEVRFLKQDTGTTQKITHSGFSTEESLKNHSRGWESYMHGFQRYLQTRSEAL